jgi:outer membrane biosynthesis protein TonB
MNITELLSNPSMIHAAVVHMPIAAAFIGIIFIVISAIFHRNNTVRALGALLFLIVVASSYVAIESGEDARDLVSPELPSAIWDPLTAHAASAEKVLYAGVFTLACLLISLIRFDMIRVVGLLLAAVGALATNIFCANTGHLGGVLVYNHGVGTPLLKQIEPTPARPEPTPTPEVPVSEMPAPEGAAPVVPAEAAPMPDPVAENPDWLPIRDFTPEEAALVSFKRDVWPIIDDQCITCHENPDADGDYEMNTVENMLKSGKKGGPGVIPGNPDESSIIKYIRGIAKPRMPEDEDPLTEDQIHTLRMWIAAGAKDDSAEAEAAPAPAEPVMEDAPATEAAPPAEVVPAPEVAPESEAAPAPETSPVPEAAPAPETAPMPEAVPAPELPQPETAPVVEEAPAPVETPAEATI